MTQVKRILSGHNRMEKLNNKIIDCLNHLWAIGDHNLAWNHKEDDDSKGKSYCYVHPESGELHNKYQGHPVKEMIFYPWGGATRIGRPRVKHSRLLNHSKRLHRATVDTPVVINKHHNVCPGETDCIHVPTDARQIAWQWLKVEKLLDTHLISHQEANQLRHKMQLYSTMPGCDMIRAHTRKQMCNSVINHAWKEKEYLREQAKLDKMIKTCQFTRIDRAFATTTGSLVMPTTSVSMPVNNESAGAVEQLYGGAAEQLKVFKSLQYCPRNMANSQRGGRKHNRKHQRNQTHPSANAATDVNRHANLTCYGCGEKGHIVPSYPKNKGKQGQPPTTAKGNAVQETEQCNSWDNELVCVACHAQLEEAKITTTPNAGPPLLIHVTWDVEQLTNMKIFASLAIWVGESTFNAEREKQISAGDLPSEYIGDLEPLNEPLWLLLHNRPLQDLAYDFTCIVYTDHRARPVFIIGINPSLKRGFNLEL
jgi:hypothetical protein